MAFNLGGGLAGAAGALSTQLLEQQKADLEAQKITLASQLAGQRESAGRQEEAGYRETAATTEFGRQGILNSQRVEAEKELSSQGSTQRIEEKKQEATQAIQEAQDRLAALSTPGALRQQRAITDAMKDDTPTVVNAGDTVINRLGEVLFKGSGTFDEPKLLEINDGQGGTKQVTGQQNKTTGQWVTADEKRAPIDATDIRVQPASGGYGGARSQVQMLRMLSAGHTLANEVENVAALPSTAKEPWFGGNVGTGTKASLLREVTPQDIQSYQTVSIGLGRALSQLETAGLAPPGAFTSQIEGLKLQPGDTEFTRLLKLATIRQTGSGILDAVANTPIASKKQVEEIASLKNRIQKAIPYEPQDVIALAKAQNPHATIADMAKAHGLGAQPSPTQTQAAPNPQDIVDELRRRGVVQ